MRDQKAILNKCLVDDIPAMVITAKDINSVPTLETYLQEAIKNGCAAEFIADLKEVINGFKSFQDEEPDKVKVPTL